MYGDYSQLFVNHRRFLAKILAEPIKLLIHKIAAKGM